MLCLAVGFGESTASGWLGLRGGPVGPIVGGNDGSLCFASVEDSDSPACPRQFVP